MGEFVHMYILNSADPRVAKNAQAEVIVYHRLYVRWGIAPLSLSA